MFDLLSFKSFPISKSKRKKQKSHARSSNLFKIFCVFAWKNVKIVSKYMRLNFCQPIWLCCGLNTAIYWYLNSRKICKNDHVFCILSVRIRILFCHYISDVQGVDVQAAFRIIANNKNKSKIPPIQLYKCTSELNKINTYNKRYQITLKELF